MKNLNRGKKKTLRKTLMSVYISIIAVICLVLTSMSMVLSGKSLKKTALDIMPEVAQMTSASVSNNIATYLAIVENVASLDVIANPFISKELKFERLEKERNRINSDTLIMVTTDGEIIREDGQKANISNRDFFQAALRGESCISSPQLNTLSKTMRFNITTPIKYNDKIEYILVATFDVKKLIAMVSDVKIGETGFAYIINEAGTTIAQADIEVVYGMGNVSEQAKQDKSLQQLSKIHDDMLKGKTGIGEFYRGRDKYAISYTPIQNTSWSLALAVPIKEITSQINLLILLMIITCIVCILIGILFTYRVSNSISNPIMLLTERIIEFKNGDLKSKMSPIKTGNELETLYISITKMATNIIN